MTFIERNGQIKFILCLGMMQNWTSTILWKDGWKIENNMLYFMHEAQRITLKNNFPFDLGNEISISDPKRKTKT